VLLAPPVVFRTGRIFVIWDFRQSVMAVLKRVSQIDECIRRTGMYLMAEEVRCQCPLQEWLATVGVGTNAYVAKIIVTAHTHLKNNFDIDCLLCVIAEKPWGATKVSPTGDFPVKFLVSELNTGEVWDIRGPDTPG
jgi:hypothetical protein